MMSNVYMTETEQLEQLKKWWQKYQNYILISLSLIMLIVSGARYWQWHTQKVNEQASNAYESLMLAFSNQDTQSMESFAQQLVSRYDGTVYADTARLIQAKLDVDSSNYQEARVRLKTVADHSKFKILADVAHLRLARILAYEKSFPEALAELDQVQDASYSALCKELRGDIHYAMGHFRQAKQDYRAAKNTIEQSGVNNLFLEMKQQEVMAAMHSSKAAHTAHAVS